MNLMLGDILRNQIFNEFHVIFYIGARRMKRLCILVVCLLCLLSAQIKILADDDLGSGDYQDFSTVESTLEKLRSYNPSGLVNYIQVVDQLFSIQSLSDLFNPYYYYSINTNMSNTTETTRTKIVSAYCDPYYYEVVMSKSDGSYEHVACLQTFEEAKELKSKVQGLTFDDGVLVVLNDGMIVISMDPTIVQFKTTTCGANHNLTNSETLDTYINACYIDEALLVDETEDAFKIYMSGYDGWVDRHAVYDASASTETWVSIIPSNQVQNISYYTKEGEDLIHYLAQDVRDALAKTPLIIGKAPQWMEEGKSYYSYDGIYFYDDWQSISVDGVGAINSSEPFYNYFQYLPYRSKTNYTYDELNTYLNQLGYTQKAVTYPPTEGESQLVDEGESFLEAQELFGINGGLEFSMALHESGYGRSKIAIDKNNTFGMNATDQNPYGNATQFTSIRNGVFYHAERYVSWGYTDAVSDFRYYGPHVGNKGSGMNVKYASDPYWGEKIAGHYYRMDKALGGKDYNYYQLAIKQNNQVIPVHLDSEGNLAYLTSNQQQSTGIRNYPVLVLAQMEDQLKIQSDMPISEQEVIESDITYNFETSEAYVSRDDFMLLNEETSNRPNEVITYVTLSVGDEVELTQLLGGSQLELSTLEFESTDESIAVIKQDKLIANSSGITRILSSKNSEIDFDVRVVIPVEKLKIKTEVRSLKVGESVTLDYELLPLDASHQNVLWLSSDEGVATVTQGGTVQGIAEGEVVISILSDDGERIDQIRLKIK